MLFSAKSDDILILNLLSFSAYRYKALLNGADGYGPLQTYFLGEKMHEPVRLHPPYSREL